MIRSPLMNVMTAVALKAGKSLRKDFGQLSSLDITKKGPGDLVSQADKRAEEIIQTELEKARPGYCYVMEESGIVDGSDKSHRWHIDPLDGTTNFLRGIPVFCTSIGLERDGQLVAGVVYNPISDDLYVAERGAGAFHNNHRMRVSPTREMVDAVLSCGIPHVNRPGQPQFLKELAVLMTRVGGVRRMGAAALDLAMVAGGHVDAYWERGLKTWDMAAGVVLVREAGGYISGLKGEPDHMDTGDILAGTEAIHAEMLKLLKPTA